MRLVVDGDRPALSWVAAIPREWKVTPGQRLVLAMLAADSYDGRSCAPGVPALAEWCGMWPSSVRDALATLERPTGDRPALIRREDFRGGRPGRIVLLAPADEPGGSTYPHPADEPGGGSADRPTGQPTGRPADRPGGQPTGRPADEAGATLGPYPEPSPHAREAVGALAKLIPDAAEARALPAEVDRALAAGWAPAGWVSVMSTRCRPSAPPGHLVNVARSLVDETPPHLARAQRDREQAVRAEQIRYALRARLGVTESDRLLDEAADVLEVPRDSLRAAREAQTNAERKHPPQFEVPSFGMPE